MRAINAVTITYGLNIFRNPTTKVESACSIVTQALGVIGRHMSEDSVVKIWKRANMRKKLHRKLTGEVQ